MIVFIFEVDELEVLGPHQWTFLVRQRSNWICERCGHVGKRVTLGKGSQEIVAHHKDRNRNNNTLANGECLCRSCHATEHAPSEQSDAWKAGIAAANKRRTFESRSSASLLAWETRRRNLIRE